MDQKLSKNNYVQEDIPENQKSNDQDLDIELEKNKKLQAEIN